jgi:hypothetical protein
LKAEEIYKSGKPDGTYTAYFENGQSKIESVPEAGKRKKKIQIRVCSRNGQLELSEVCGEKSLGDCLKSITKADNGRAMKCTGAERPGNYSGIITKKEAPWGRAIGSWGS